MSLQPLARLAELGKDVLTSDLQRPEVTSRLVRKAAPFVLDHLIGPGAGRIADAGLQILEKHGLIQPDAIEGEYTVVEDGYPWAGFAKRLARQRWGSYVVLGPKGQGKTTLALRLAEVWHRRTGYQVEVVNLYPEDATWFTGRVGMGTFAKRMKALTTLLEGDAEDEDDEPGDSSIDEQALERLKRRVIVIDEASLVLHPQGSRHGIRAARRAVAQARHLSWLVIYVTQLAKMMPMDFLGAEAIFVKQPQGWEAEVDRDDPLIQQLWTDASAAFSRVKHSPWWEDLPDSRAWTYADSRGLPDGPGYRGILPVHVPSATREEVA